MQLPEDLSVKLYPLAWMLGSWEGWGTLPGGEDEDDKYALMVLEVRAVGDQLHHSLRVSGATQAGDLPVSATAAEGMNALTRDCELWAEYGIWGLTNSVPGTAEQPPHGEGSIQLTSGRYGGNLQFAVTAHGPQVHAKTTDIAGALWRGERLVEAARMYGLVGGELMWMEEAAPNGQQVQPAVSGRLMRGNTQQQAWPGMDDD